MNGIVEQCVDQSSPYSKIDEKTFLFVLDSSLEYWLMLDAYENRQHGYEVTKSAFELMDVAVKGMCV